MQAKIKAVQAKTVRVLEHAVTGLRVVIPSAFDMRKIGGELMVKCRAYPANGNPYDLRLSLDSIVGEYHA